MLHRIRHFLIGSPLPTYLLNEKRLNKVRALAAFSPDALSSIAYANQEIYLGLVVAGALGLSLSFPIGLAIAVLLAVVAFSYAQTIQGYPSGGGSYVVARDNLGISFGLVAAAALMIDYVLTAAVSLTAGVSAIASAFPQLYPFRVVIALSLLVILTVANLRGLRESGTMMAVPVYLFLFTYLPMLAWGGVQLLTQGPVALASVAPPPTEPLRLMLVLHAFAAGCTALTGIEAISNGVPAFQEPVVPNARKTLGVMAVLMFLLFVGSVGLTQFLGVVAGGQETILSALARRVVGNGFFYYLIQTTTLLVLAVAANTSFAGFPRVAAILAADKFLPRQLTGLGDRLVFSNGIVALAAAAGILIIVFNGDPHALVPLFAIGAFLAFTLSQTGMVLHWLRVRQPGWQPKALVNGLGALVTGLALIIIAVAKFVEGAWISIVVIPLLVAMFYKIRSHYRDVARQLTLKGLPPSLRPEPPPRVVIPISGVHRGTIAAVNFARGLTSELTAVYIELEPGSGERVKTEWQAWFPDTPIELVPSPYRSMIGPLIEYLERIDREHNDGKLASVVVPEFIPAKWWQIVLHNQSAWAIKNALLYGRRNLGHARVVIDIPYYLRD